MSISPSNESTEAFSVDLRLLLELGERLISKDEVAVVELVKNAYDADAKNCRVTIDSDAIVVADDGCGMDTEQVKSAWLALGTSSKKRSPTSLGGRRVLGEKGIGRLAVIRLGSRAEVLTRRQNGNTLRVSMDWQSAADKIAAGQPVPLADFKVSLEAYDGVFDKEHGTEIKITRVRHTWAATQIESLRNTLSRLVEPWTDEKPDFSISMNSNGEDLEVEPPEIIQNPHYRLRVQKHGSKFALYAFDMKPFRGRSDVVPALNLLHLDGGFSSFGRRHTIKMGGEDGSKPRSPPRPDQRRIIFPAKLAYARANVPEAVDGLKSWHKDNRSPPHDMLETVLQTSREYEQEHLVGVARKMTEWAQSNELHHVLDGHEHLRDEVRRLRKRNAQLLSTGTQTTLL